jgi:hypothetical protein
MLGHIENKPGLVARFADYLVLRPFAAPASGVAGSVAGGAYDV